MNNVVLHPVTVNCCLILWVLRESWSYLSSILQNEKRFLMVLKITLKKKIQTKKDKPVFWNYVSRDVILPWCILLDYASLLKALEVYFEEKLDADIWARINRCDSQMKTFNFFFSLHLGKRLFVHTDNLSKTLQSPSLSAAAGQRLAGLTVETLQLSIRN